MMAMPHNKDFFSGNSQTLSGSLNIGHNHGISKIGLKSMSMNYNNNPIPDNVTYGFRS